MAALRCLQGKHADPVKWHYRCDTDSADLNLHIFARSRLRFHKATRRWRCRPEWGGDGAVCVWSGVNPLPTINLIHFTQVAYLAWSDVRCSFVFLQAFRFHKIGAIRCCTIKCCTKVVFCTWRTKYETNVEPWGNKISSKKQNQTIRNLKLEAHS